MKRAKTDQERIDREAADWVVKWEDREHSPAPKEQSRWFGWLQRSPRHLQSYLDTADLYERLGAMDSSNKIDVDEWLAARRAPVVSIARPVPESAMRSSSASTVSRRWWLGAAASLVGIVVVASWSTGVFGPPSFRTAVGQQSISRLDDGSIVNLNTRSRVKVRFSDTERVVELEGEAMFTVAKDSARPFLVRTRGATVRAVGTIFNVYERENETRVAVLEGTVRVTSGKRNGTTAQPGVAIATADGSGSTGAIMALSAGEAALVSAGQVAKVEAPDIEAETAWQQRKLVFEDVPLETVATQFNRYNKRQLRVDGFIGQTKRLSGTFDALHPQSLLLFLQRDETVTVEPSGDDFVVRARE